VTECTTLLSQLRLEVTAGVEAVEKVFHSAGGDEDMSEEQRKLLKEYNTQKEKEAKAHEQYKIQQQALEAKQDHRGKWSGGGGGPGQGGYRAGPYYYGGGDTG